MVDVAPRLIFKVAAETAPRFGAGCSRLARVVTITCGPGSLSIFARSANRSAAISVSGNTFSTAANAASPAVLTWSAAWDQSAHRRTSHCSAHLARDLIRDRNWSAG